MIQKIKIIKTLIIIFSLVFSFSANAMTVEEIMQYDWITSSSKASDGNDVFIDYKKVPLQMENDEL